MKTKNLTEMRRGEIGTIVDIQGDHGLVARLHNMGLRKGKKIKKVGAHLWRGPNIVRLGKLQIVVGHGMAQRIVVGVDA